jgi:hypothetical protein
MYLSALLRYNPNFRLVFAVFWVVVLFSLLTLSGYWFLGASYPAEAGRMLMAILFASFCFFRVMDIYFENPIFPKLVISLSVAAIAGLNIYVLFFQSDITTYLKIDTVKHMGAIGLLTYYIFECAAALGEWLWRCLPFGLKKQLTSRLKAQVTSHDWLPAVQKVALLLATIKMIYLGTRISIADPNSNNWVATMGMGILSLILMSIALIIFVEMSKFNFKQWTIIGISAMMAFMPDNPVYMASVAMGILILILNNRFTGLFIRNILLILAIVLIFAMIVTLAVGDFMLHLFTFEDLPWKILGSYGIMGMVFGFIGLVLPYFHDHPWGKFILAHSGFWVVGIISGINEIKICLMMAALVLFWVCLVKVMNSFRYNMLAEAMVVPEAKEPI